MTGQWDAVPERLERLRQARLRGETSRVFGADGISGGGHRFELAPPLGEPDLAAAEAQFGVRLPAQYRDFLLTVGAGGAGPAYGLFPLARDAGGHWGWPADGGDPASWTALAIDFEPGDVSAALAGLEAAQPSPGDAGAYGRWLLQFDEMLWAQGRTDGAVAVSHEGCGHYDWLVVSGPHRGLMWGDGRASDSDLAPLTDRSGSALTFGRWYLEWLDRAERAVWRS